MRALLRSISLVALAATLAAPVAYLAGAISLEATQRALLLATCGWFVLAPGGAGVRAADSAGDR